MKVKKFKCYLMAVLILLAANSCQKVVNLQLDNAVTQIVIEGNITNVRGTQTVTISQSVPFTNSNSFPPVSGATVTINDDKGNSYKLTESTTVHGTYSIASLAGKSGSTYTLTVVANGQTYTASSTMPGPVFYQPLSYNNDTFKTGSQLITVNFMDPLNVPNQYRFVLYVNNVQAKAIFVSNDLFTDGGSVDINLYQNDFTIVKGDNILVEEQGIDQNMFNYWFSLSQQQDNGSGVGTTPANPPSNLSNGALGYFSAHTEVQQGTVIQ